MNQEHLLTTRGITSIVREEDERLGHAMLLDYDDGVGWSHVLDVVEQLDGLTAVFESSPGSWHVWNTGVRSLDETALAMLSRKCDPMHTSVGYRRKRWTLRVGPKDRINAGAGFEDEAVEYKSEPEAVMWSVSPSELDHSEPHVKTAAALLDRDGVADADDVVAAARGRLELVGDALNRNKYLTLTDEGKALARGGEDGR